MKSLQWRMMAALGMAVAACWTVALCLLMSYLSHNQNSIWDDKLESIGNQILTTIPGDTTLDSPGPEALGRPRPTLQLRPGASSHTEPLAIQIWLVGQRLAFHSPGAPAQALRPDFQEGLATTMVEGQSWRAYSVSDRNGMVYVQVGYLHSAIDQELGRKAIIALALNTALLVMLGGLMWCAVSRSLRPLGRITAALRERRKFDLTPLPTVDIPREIRPLVESFNTLMTSLDHAVRAERRFIGDAAHELRTPLSALHAQAEVALHARNNDDKDAALRKLLDVSERSTRLSEQLLDLARLEAGLHASQREPAELSDLIVYVASEFELVAASRGLKIALLTEPCQIDCDVDEIGILLRNLLDNAIRYGRDGGRIRVSCGRRTAPQGDGVFVEVADDGPGVPPDQRGAIFERFHRVAGNKARGSGIGLSLVAAIAKVHNATIETCDGLEGCGFCIRIVFPAADTDRTTPA